MSWRIATAARLFCRRRRGEVRTHYRFNARQLQDIDFLHIKQPINQNSVISVTEYHVKTRKYWRNRAKFPLQLIFLSNAAFIYHNYSHKRQRKYTKFAYSSENMNYFSLDIACLHRFIPVRRQTEGMWKKRAFAQTSEKCLFTVERLSFQFVSDLESKQRIQHIKVYIGNI